MYQLAGDKPTESLDPKESQVVLEDRRLVELLLDGGWHMIYFREIKEGDRFRMFDSKTEEPIKNSLGETEFIATTNAYLAEHRELKTITYHVQIAGKEMENV
jgi:hypothetical protein